MYRTLQQKQRFCLHCRVFYERMQEMTPVENKIKKITYLCRRCNSLEYAIDSVVTFDSGGTYREKEEEALEGISSLHST